MKETLPALREARRIATKCADRARNTSEDVFMREYIFNNVYWRVFSRLVDKVYKAPH